MNTKRHMGAMLALGYVDATAYEDRGGAREPVVFEKLLADGRRVVVALESFGNTFATACLGWTWKIQPGDERGRDGGKCRPTPMDAAADAARWLDAASASAEAE